jgi:hypothetical protein
MLKIAFVGSLAVVGITGAHIAAADTHLPEPGAMLESQQQPSSNAELAIAGLTGLGSLGAAGIFHRMLGEQPSNPS